MNKDSEVEFMTVVKSSLREISKQLRIKNTLQ